MTGPALRFAYVDAWLHSMAALNKARIYLLHLDRIEDRLSLVHVMLDHDDIEMVERLADELDSADKADLAARVRAVSAQH